MNESSNPPEPTEATPTDPLKQPRRFRWEKNYELQGGYHWALNDTYTDAGPPPGRVTCGEMILQNHWNKDLGEAEFPKLIVDLLNKHFQEQFDKANAPAAADAESLAGSQNWLRLERMILKRGSMIVYALENKSGFMVRFDGAGAVQGGHSQVGVDQNHRCAFQ